MTDFIRDPMYAALADEGTLAECIERELRNWLDENIVWPLGIERTEADRIMDDIVDELMASGFSFAVGCAWPAIARWQRASAEQVPGWMNGLVLPIRDGED